MDKQGKNPFFEKLKKYINKDVKLITKSGHKIEGKLIAVNFLQMNFIIHGNDDHDYIIRDDMSYISIKTGGEKK